MPTLLNLNGFKFFFYANEHEPKHVHVIYGGDFAKVELALQIISEYREEFERRWDEYFS